MNRLYTIADYLAENEVPIKALFIPVIGQCRIVYVPSTHPQQIQALQQIVSGNVGYAHVEGSRHCFYCNVNGRVFGMPPNVNMASVGSTTVGDVVMVGTASDGSDCSIDERVDIGNSCTW
jgi:hypothetical protein